ncbi:MAG TPA: imidazole glycerol phosphate synthase subunit HisH [Longimicrobium sp.]
MRNSNASAAMIAIVDYGMGNLGSIHNMFRKVGAQAVVTADPAVVARAEKLVLPGVGAFDHGMRSLAERGLVEVLNRKALQERVPVLGVCLGMQLLTERSDEGGLPGLGWIEGETVRFDRTDQPRLHAMHMGWNTLDWHAPHPIFGELPPHPRFYFVHAYHVVCRHERNVLARSTYGYPFASAVVEGNVVGMQFHPEKSHRFGMAVFRAFAALGAAEAVEPAAVGAGAAG